MCNTTNDFPAIKNVVLTLVRCLNVIIQMAFYCYILNVSNVNVHVYICLRLNKIIFIDYSETLLFIYEI